MKLQHLIFTIAICCLLPTFTTAQGFSYGVRVGLNFANISGDLEQDDSGENIEELNNNTGFHVGASVKYNFNDRFGVKADFLYSQKGTQQIHKGQDAQLFYKVGTNEQVGLTGTQDRFLRITNSYIEIPISAYGKFGKVEFFGGPYVAFLVSSKGVGDYKSTIDDLNTDLNFNYFKDDIIDAANLELNSEDYETFTSGGKELFYPDIFEAYDDFRTKDGKAFNSIDFGLNAGMAFYFNKGLYISANVHYGLTDVSNKAYDHSYGSLNEDGTQYAERDDVDRNFAIQTSVGFAF